MIRLPPLVCIVLPFSFMLTSCDEEWPEDPVCSCGGEIGGWEVPIDTTLTETSDSTAGFALDVNNWGDTTTVNVKL